MKFERHMLRNKKRNDKMYQLKVEFYNLYISLFPPADLQVHCSCQQLLVMTKFERFSMKNGREIVKHLFLFRLLVTLTFDLHT